MIRILHILTVLWVFTAAAAGAETADIAQTREDFEKYAARLSYLPVGEVIFDRTGHALIEVPSEKRNEYSNVIEKITDRAYSEKVLILLLDDVDSRIRTLAAVALFDREDPSLLPFLVRLSGDDAETFPRYEPMSIASPDSGNRPPPVRQTVRNVAEKMIRFYLEKSGFYYSLADDFRKYWEARKDRAYTAGWFAVQLARASRGISPTQNDTLERIHAVRKRIDLLPKDDRTWILLWLNGEEGSDALVTESELIEGCKALGPDKLLLMLQNQIPSDDPDLQSRPNNNWFYKRMSILVLRHAEELLRPEDSDRLLECERWQRDYQKHQISDPAITSWWAIAASRLKPANASEILHSAMDRFQGEYEADERSNLGVALWQLAGRSELEFIANWFYGEHPQRGQFPNCRASFIEATGKEANGREAIARLVRDERLENADWQSLEQLVRVVNSWLKSPIVTEDEIRSAWHPFGQAHFDWMQVEAEKQYPQETRDLRAHLNEWRTRLRTALMQQPSE